MYQFSDFFFTLALCKINFYLQFVNKISHCKLLFINNYKGEKNPGPSDDVSEFKYCSATLTDIGHGTLRPPDDGTYSEDWGHSILEQSNNREKTSFKQHCMINSCTDEGL